MIKLYIIIDQLREETIRRQVLRFITKFILIAILNGVILKAT